MSDLSFAIVTYNSSKQIKETIESIQRSIPKIYSFDIYVVDNASSDDTLDVVRGISNEIVVVERKTNDGFAAGHNALLERLVSKYHFVVNPDIIIENVDHILKMLRYLDLHPDVGLLVPLLLNEDRSVQYLCKRNPTVFDMIIRRFFSGFFKRRQNAYVMKDSGYNKIMTIEYASGSFMVFRTNIFKKLNGFDAKYFMYLEDADITRRTNMIAKAVFFPEASVIHKWERGSYKSLKLAIVTLKSMWIYFNRWGWKFW